VTAEVSSSPPLTILVFGPMQVLVHNRPLPPFRSRKALWLLALMALRQGRSVEREWLAGALWPDTDTGRAFTNLRVNISELRQAFGDQGERLSSPNRRSLALDLTGARVDLHIFDAAIQSQNLQALHEAVQLYRGPLLADCTEEWVRKDRAKRVQNCLQALLTLADDALAKEDHAAAVGYCQQALTIHPLGEAALRRLMTALANSGDHNAALYAYRKFVELLRRETNSPPDEQTYTLYLRLRAETRAHAETQAATTASTPARLIDIAPSKTIIIPQPDTPLVGRIDERNEVAAMLRRSRLVTLIGPGGIGKTRLAIETARDIGQEYLDGVQLVPLETVAEGALVAQQVALTLGLRENAHHILEKSVIEFLSKKRFLLVLDNCEHLIEAAAQFSGQLLRECGGVSILATSREALGIFGETIWPVPPLATPDPISLNPAVDDLLQTLSAYESVQLFVERAQSVHSAFVLTETNALAIAQTCWYLGGIPLAIELAAVQVKRLSVEQMATHLDDHPETETGVDRTTPRQRTLRATLDWSYTLLNEAERYVLRCVSVFSGGWTLEAAEQICAGSVFEPSEIKETAYRLHAEEVLDLLTVLINKSLVIFTERDSGGRYRLLEPVRQYAAEQLQAAGEMATVKNRHRDWFLAFAERTKTTGSDAASSLQRLETEHDNLRAALAWCRIEPQSADAGLRLVSALWRFWHLHGHFSEGRRLLAQALEVTGATERTAMRAKALNGAGSLAISQNDYASAQTLLEESLSIARELGDRSGLAAATGNLSNVFYRRGDYTAARMLNEESLQLYRELGDRVGVARTLNGLGNVATRLGDLKTARALFEESLSIRRELEDRPGIALAIDNLGNLLYKLGEYASARLMFEESLSIRTELGDKHGIGVALLHLAYMDVDYADYASARTRYEESLGLLRDVGDYRGMTRVLTGQGNIALHAGDYASARGLYDDSLNLQRELGDRLGMAYTLECQGRLALSEQNYVQAQALFVQSLSIRKDLGDLQGIPACLEYHAEAMLAQGQDLRAVRLWGAAAALHETLGMLREPANRKPHDLQVSQARSLLGPHAFAAAWEEGYRLSWTQAIDMALSTDNG
jgi:predicted ATPase/DNA-binding SARP family transcriptional activator